MKIPAIFGAGALTLALAGCASSSLERHFRSGELSEVARVFEADSMLHAKPGALYRAGLAYALPESPVYDPERALQLFDRLQTEHPKHSQREHVSQLSQMLKHAHLHQERQLVRDARLRAQQTQIDDLKAQLARERTRAETLRTTADRLDRELRERESRIRSLQEELAALKRIDLNRPPSGGTSLGGAGRAPRP